MAFLLKTAPLNLVSPSNLDPKKSALSLNLALVKVAFLNVAPVKSVGSMKVALVKLGESTNSTLRKLGNLLKVALWKIVFSSNIASVKSVFPLKKDS